jgi:carbon monoxide dehydrogenase subunit G
MPEVAYTTELRVPLDAVWAFVSDMNNWAPFLVGYQKHEIIDTTDSLWTLKGDVGILSRVVELRAHVTEWIEPSYDGAASGPKPQAPAEPCRVSFTLTGVNEVVDGGGTLVLRRADTAVTPAPGKPALGLFRRILGALARLVHRLAHGSAPPAALPEPTHAGEGVALELTLRMEAGGPAGPLVNAMLGPALEPAVEDLASKIAARLQGWPRVEGR